MDYGNSGRQVSPARKLFSKSFLIISIIESWILSIGNNIRSNGIVIGLVNPRAGRFLLGIVICYVILLAADVLLNLTGSMLETSRISVKLMPYKTTLITLLILWIPQYIIMFPGSAAFDCKNQINEFFEGVLLQNTPFLQTTLTGLFIKLGIILGNINIGIGLYTFLQLIFGICCIAYTVNTIYLVSKRKALWILCLVFFAINPCFPIVLTGMGKDANWSCFLLLTFSSLLRIAENNTTKNRIVFIVSAIFTILLRNIGLLYMAVIWIIYAIRIRKGILYIVLIPLAFTILMNNVVFRLFFSIDKTNYISENLSLPLMQVAGVVNEHGDELSEKEKTVIGSMIDYDACLKRFSYDVSDPIKDTYNASATGEETEFWKLYITLMFRYPESYIETLIRKSIAYFDPLSSCQWKSFTYMDINVLKLSVVEETQDVRNYFDLGFYQEYQNMLMTTPGVNLITRNGFYFFVFLLCLGRAIRRKSKNLLYLFFPLCIFEIGLVFSPINGLFRYGLPMVFLMPVLLSDPFGYEIKTKNDLRIGIHNTDT